MTTLPESDLAMLRSIPSGPAAIARITALEAERNALREALLEAIAEIEGTPYQSEPWGWGIAYRIDTWRSLISAVGP